MGRRCEPDVPYLKAGMAYFISTLVGVIFRHSHHYLFTLILDVHLRSQIEFRLLFS